MDYVSAGKKAAITRRLNREKLTSNSQLLLRRIKENEPEVKVLPVKDEQVYGVEILNQGTGTNTTNKYSYDKVSDTYYTYIKSANSTVAVPGELHRDMHKAYSDWAGKEATVSDMAQKWGKSPAWVTEYKNHSRLDA